VKAELPRKTDLIGWLKFLSACKSINFKIVGSLSQILSK